MLMLITSDLLVNALVILISIHLMLMLINFAETSFRPLLHFNTSHVNVNQILPILFLRGVCNFNTSHVNVNR